ncbi:hypothetical protein LguiA_036743 [Lonicera macranthoides]
MKYPRKISEIEPKFTAPQCTQHRTERHKAPPSRTPHSQSPNKYTATQKFSVESRYTQPKQFIWNAQSSKTPTRFS